MMKKKTLAVAIARKLTIVSSLASLFLLASCSGSTNSGDTPLPSNMATIRATTGMEHKTITSSTTTKSPQILGNKGTTADSVVITRARIVIRTLKLRIEGEDDGDDTIWHDDNDKHHDRDHDGKDDDRYEIKAGPFVAEFNDSSEKIISNVVIPPGVYDRIRFEIHKLNDNEDASLLNDPLFGDFVNGGRYTFLIDGISFVNGVGYPFTFRSSQTDVVYFNFEPPVLFDSAHAYDLTLKFDPTIMFGRPGLRPLDPRDVDNRNDIEKLLKNAIKALRKVR
ncbi:MAG: hypothetical protein ABI778_06325 [Ignavibacteriota bacterium]